MCKKYIILNPSAWTCEISACVKSIDDDAKIICDEIINVTNTTPTNFDNKNAKHEMSCCILHTVLLYTVMYCYSYLLPFVLSK